MNVFKLFCFIFLSFIAWNFIGCKVDDQNEDVHLTVVDIDTVSFGKALFFDKRLSLDNSIACATCHQPRLAFTDGKRFSEGVEGRKSMRNAPSLLNVENQSRFMFDAHISSLEMQAIVPIQDTNEMGIRMEDLIKKLQKDSIYSAWSNELFGREIDPSVITQSLAVFQRTLIARNSRFDQFMQGNSSVFTDSETKGWQLFSTELNCIACHQLPDLKSDDAKNNGLYLNYGEDKGRFRIHYDSTDIGKFKVPTLRNISLTSPYMHDGSFLSLEEVINHYESGGKGHFNQDTLIKPFRLSKEEKKNVLNFLNSLTDTSYMKRFQ